MSLRIHEAIASLSGQPRTRALPNSNPCTATISGVSIGLIGGDVISRPR